MLIHVLLLFSVQFQLAYTTSSIGTQFVTALFPNIGTENLKLSKATITPTWYLILSNDNNAAATVHVSSPYAGFGNAFTLTVQAHNTIRYPLEINGLPISEKDGEYVSDSKGILLSSSQPISFTVFSEGVGESDAYTILPIPLLGTSYYTVVSGSPYQNNIYTIIAAQDQTNVIVNGRAMRLSQAQTLSFASKEMPSGIFVSSDKPVAVISGCICGQDTTGNGCGMETTMLLPTTAWGTTFPLVPFTNPDPGQPNKQLYRVVASQMTTVSVNGQVQGTLEAGGSLDISNNGVAAMLTSNKPVQVIQVGRGKPFDWEDNFCPGDEFFLIVPSPTHFVSGTVRFYPTNYFQSAFTNLHYVRIVTNSTNVGHIQLDGAVISALKYVRIGTSTFYYYDAPISLYQHVVTGNNGATFTVASYSYAWASGAGYIPVINV